MVVYVRVVNKGVYGLREDDFNRLIEIIRRFVREDPGRAVREAVNFVESKGKPVDVFSLIGVEVNYVLLTDPDVVKLFFNLIDKD